MFICSQMENNLGHCNRFFWPSWNWFGCRRWTVPLIGRSSEHNFRRVERDISCVCKLFQGILSLYVKSKRPCRAKKFSPSLLAGSRPHCVHCNVSLQDTIAAAIGSPTLTVTGSLHRYLLPFPARIYVIQKDWVFQCCYASEVHSCISQK